MHFCKQNGTSSVKWTNSKCHSPPARRLKWTLTTTVTKSFHLLKISIFTSSWEKAIKKLQCNEKNLNFLLKKIQLRTFIICIKQKYAPPYKKRNWQKKMYGLYTNTVWDWIFHSAKQKGETSLSNLNIDVYLQKIRWSRRQILDLCEIKGAVYWVGWWMKTNSTSNIFFSFSSNKTRKGHS